MTSSLVWRSLTGAVLVCVVSSSLGLAQDEKEIVAARDRGVKFLKSVQKGDGHWEYAGHELGITALCTIALIENGVPLEDESIQKGYNYVRSKYKDLANTYDLALGIVCLSRFGDRRDKPMIRELAARLMAGQKDSGGWHYTCPKDVDTDKVLRDPVGVKLGEGFGDNSCTQFAVLGLWVASRSGVNIDKTLERVAKRFQTTQKQDGGWSYSNSETEVSSGPAMTGAGLFCLAVAEAHKIREAQKASGGKPGDTQTKSLMEDRRFKDGFDRTGKFAPAVAAGNNRYFMWSIERVGVLLGLEKIGTTEWYKEGSKGLLKEQKEAGNWVVSGPGGDADKDGLSDTSFALLFLRKANLGSDISRLLEGESEQKFENVTQKTKFTSLQEAISKAKPGDTIRIDSAGPHMVGNLELKDITLQAGFGVAPVFKFEIGKNRLGIRLRPETDPNARNMISVTGGKVTLEGLRLQMDPPTLKNVAWNAVVVKGGTLRLLNCTVSEANKQGSSGVAIQAPGQHVIRNSLLVGGRAGIEVTGVTQPQEVVVDNCVIFSNSAIRVVNDVKKAPAALKVTVRRSAIQAREIIDTAKLVGTVAVDSTMSVYQAEWLGSSFLTSEKDTKSRSWSGSVNLYDVKNFIGVGGKPVAGITDGKTWSAFWKGADKDGAKRVAAFLGVQQLGNFSHEANVQTWTIEVPEDAESFFQRSPVGINAYIAGSGGPYDQYRDTFSYTQWTRGDLGLGLNTLTSAASSGAR